MSTFPLSMPRRIEHFLILLLVSAALWGCGRTGLYIPPIPNRLATGHCLAGPACRMQPFCYVPANNNVGCTFPEDSPPSVVANCQSLCAAVGGAQDSFERHPAILRDGRTANIYCHDLGSAENPQVLAMRPGEIETVTVDGGTSSQYVSQAPDQCYFTQDAWHTFAGDLTHTGFGWGPWTNMDYELADLPCNPTVHACGINDWDQRITCPDHSALLGTVSVVVPRGHDQDAINILAARCFTFSDAQAINLTFMPGPYAPEYGGVGQGSGTGNPPWSGSGPRPVPDDDYYRDSFVIGFLDGNDDPTNPNRVQIVDDTLHPLPPALNPDAAVDYQTNPPVTDPGLSPLGWPLVVTTGSITITDHSSGALITTDNATGTAAIVFNAAPDTYVALTDLELQSSGTFASDAGAVDGSPGGGGGLYSSATISMQDLWPGTHVWATGGVSFPAETAATGLAYVHDGTTYQISSTPTPGTVVQGTWNPTGAGGLPQLTLTGVFSDGTDDYTLNLTLNAAARPSATIASPSISPQPNYRCGQTCTVPQATFECTSPAGVTFAPIGSVTPSTANTLWMLSGGLTTSPHPHALALSADASPSMTLPLYPLFSPPQTLGCRSEADAGVSGISGRAAVLTVA